MCAMSCHPPPSHTHTHTQASLLQQCRDLEGKIITVRAGGREAEEGRRGVEATLEDARREISDNAETLRNQTEKAEQLSNMVRERQK